MEMIFIALMCFILGMVYSSGGKGKMDKQIMSFLKAGKRVIVVVDNDATIFEMTGNKIKITKAETSFNIVDDVVDLPRGAGNELVTDSMDSGGSNQSGNYNESGVAD